MIFTESENARVRKNIIHHLFSIAALCAVVFTNTIWLTGCVIYDSKDLAKFAKEQLYKKYGEEFEVKTIMDSHRTIAYPVNDPDLLFEVYSLIETRGGKDDYIQSIIGDQYKKIVEKTFADVNLYFYIDVDVPSIPFKEKEIKNTNITIEEYNDEMSAYSVQPKIDLYLSSDFLDCYSNEELYFFMKSIVSDTNPRFLRVTFILLDDEKTVEEYEKISKYIQKNKDRKILLIELGVGRMTPMFIQEPFWELTNSLKDAYYISVNSEYQFLPEFIEDKGIAILGDIGTVLKDLQKAKEESAFV